MPWHSTAVRLFQGPIWLWHWVQLSQFEGLKCLLAHVCLSLCQPLSLVSRNYMFNLLVKIMAMCSKQVSHMLFWSFSWQKQPGCDFGVARECQRTLISYLNRLEKQNVVRNKSRHFRVRESRFLSFCTAASWTSHGAPADEFHVPVLYGHYASGMNSTSESQNFDNSHCFMKNLHFFHQTSSG